MTINILKDEKGWLNSVNCLFDGVLMPLLTIF